MLQQVPLVGARLSLTRLYSQFTKRLQTRETSDIKQRNSCRQSYYVRISSTILVVKLQTHHKTTPTNGRSEFQVYSHFFDVTHLLTPADG